MGQRSADQYIPLEPRSAEGSAQSVLASGQRPAESEVRAPVTSQVPLVTVAAVDQRSAVRECEEHIVYGGTGVSQNLCIGDDLLCNMDPVCVLEQVNVNDIEDSSPSCRMGVFDENIYTCSSTIFPGVPWDIRTLPRHSIGGLTSQMNIHSWIYYLDMEDKTDKRDYLYEGILNGFRIVDEDENLGSYECENYKSVLSDQAFEYVSDLIRCEMNEDKFVRAEIQPTCVHALGAIPKHDGSYRPITDCRRPEGYSINNFMETTFCTFNYTTMDQVTEMVMPHCYMATVDVSSAYRSVSIREDNWPYQGISWPIDGVSVHLYDVRLSFGLRCAPFIFTEISNFIVRTMSRLGFPYVANYLDDFLVF